jgi:hypothetical protein
MLTERGKEIVALLTPQNRETIIVGGRRPCRASLLGVLRRLLGKEPIKP